MADVLPATSIQLLPRTSTHVDHRAFVAKPASNHNTFDQGETWRVNIRADDDAFVTNADGTRPDWFWTGPAPAAGAPGILPDGTITSLPLPDLRTCTRQQFLDYFDNTWLITEIMFSGLQGLEAFYRPPAHNLRHPMVFYYAHPAALYVNKLRVAGLVHEPVNAYYEHIFETGVDEMAWDDLSKNEMLWPKIREVTEYRREVYQLVRRIIETLPDFDTPGSVTWDSPAWAAFMGFEHERIHIETSTVLIRELPLGLVQAPAQWPPVHPELLTRPAPLNPLVKVGADDVTLGKPLDWPTYGWDNEYGSRTFHVREFEASKFHITNAEFLDFVCDEGYRRKDLWSEDGWRWRTFRNAKWPHFWVPTGPAGLHTYSLRLIWAVVDLPLAAPAVVNVHEARAYCAWRSGREQLASADRYRLLCEVEHARVRGASAHSARELAPLAARAGQDAAAARAEADWAAQSSGDAVRNTCNLQMAWGSEVPVDVGAASATGFVGASGNVWQWCEDLMAALPGSHGVHPLYDDFTSPCYDGQHTVILGGSFMSTGDEASIFARFHFRPHFHQHAGFRIVKGNGPVNASHIDSPPPHVGAWNPSSSHSAAEDAGKSAAALATKLLTDFAPSAGLPAPLSGVLSSAALDFPSAIMSVLSGLEFAGKPWAQLEVLEVGCGVGGVSFRLAGHAATVTAIDLDADNIAAACRLQAEGRARISVKREGELLDDAVVTVPASSAAREKVTFRQMDPCCIAPDIGTFDVTLVNGVIDKSVSPKGPLARMGGVSPIVRPHGYVVVISGYDWNENLCDPRLWLGGRKDQPDSRDGLAAALGSQFVLIGTHEVPVVSRRDARHFCVELADVTVWQRQA